MVGIYIHLPRIYLHFLPHGAQCVPRTLIESTLRDVSALGDQPRTLWQCYSSAVLQTYVEGAWGQAGRRIHDDLANLTIDGSNHHLLVQQFRLLCHLLVTIGEPIDVATMRSMLLRKLPPSIQQEIRGRSSPNRPPPTLEEVIQQAMIHAPVHEAALLTAMAMAPGYRQGSAPNSNGRRPNTGGQRNRQGRQGAPNGWPNRLSAGYGLCYGFAYNGRCPSPATCQFSHDERALAMYRDQLTHELDQLTAGSPSREAGPPRASHRFNFRASHHAQDFNLLLDSGASIEGIVGVRAARRLGLLGRAKTVAPGEERMLVGAYNGTLKRYVTVTDIQVEGPDGPATLPPARRVWIAPPTSSPPAST